MMLFGKKSNKKCIQIQKMEDGIERSISMLLETMDKIKSSNNDKKKPPSPRDLPKVSNDKKNT